LTSPDAERLSYKRMELSEILLQVKHNCDISDAGSWGYYSICGLLMRLRELYFHEHGLVPWESVPMEEISSWIHERETLWQKLEDEELRAIVVQDASYDPFDVDGLNALLKGSGMIYGSGYGVLGKPTFFIAGLEGTKEILDYEVFFAGRELCRDLSAAPAMLQGRCIYIRYESIRSIIWDKFQTLRAGRYRGLIEEMFLHFGIRKSDDLTGAFPGKMEEMTRAVADIFVLHEVGEAFEDDYSDEWTEILNGGFDKQSELYIRAAKDILADTSDMGPLREIMDRRDEKLLKVYIAFLDGIRKELFPEIRNAFQQFVESRDWSLIVRARHSGYERARGLRDHVLALWREKGREAGVVGAVRKYVEDTFPTGS
jgi:hypothetical protein